MFQKQSASGKKSARQMKTYPRVFLAILPAKIIFDTRCAQASVSKLMIATAMRCTYALQTVRVFKSNTVILNMVAST